MLSTKDIIATKGRASFLGERAKGHIDPVKVDLLNLLLISVISFIK